MFSMFEENCRSGGMKLVWKYYWICTRWGRVESSGWDRRLEYRIDREGD